MARFEKIRAKRKAVREERHEEEKRNIDRLERAETFLLVVFTISMLTAWVTHYIIAYFGALIIFLSAMQLRLAIQLHMITHKIKDTEEAITHGRQ